MDISVSHLNRRMALQIPAEFPLGLVFVVGEVEVDSTLVNEDGLRVSSGRYFVSFQFGRQRQTRSILMIR